MLMQKLKKLFLLPQAIVFIIVMIVVISGMVYSISLGDSFQYADEHEYFNIANNLLSNGLFSMNGIHSTAFRTPIYPLFLSLFIFLGLKVVALRFINFVFFAASIIILYKILQESASKIAGLIAVFFVILYPVLFYSAGTLLPTTLSSFFLLLSIYFIFHKNTYSAKYALLSGLSIGLLLLSIPTFLFVFVVTMLFLIIRRHDFKTPIVIIIAVSLVIMPWVVRNYLIFDSFIPFSTNGGMNLFIGNSPNTTANAGMNIDISEYRLHAPNKSEIEQDAYYRFEAIKFITENKRKSLILYFQKTLNYFNYRNELATKTQALFYADLLMFITYYPLLALFTIRLFLIRRYSLSHIEQYFIVIYILNAFFQAIFFTRIRFRLPYDFLLIGVVAIFISHLLKMHKWKGCLFYKYYR